MAEWSIAFDLKSKGLRGPVSSNLTLSFCKKIINFELYKSGQTRKVLVSII